MIPYFRKISRLNDFFLLILFVVLSLSRSVGQIQGPPYPPGQFSPGGLGPGMQPIGGAGGMYSPYQNDLAVGSSAETDCYNCLQPDGNCFEGECRGLSCFKIKGYRNGQWLTYKGCLYQYAAGEFRDGCHESSYNGIQGYMCTCSNRRYCNSSVKLSFSIVTLVAAVFMLLCRNTSL